MTNILSAITVALAFVGFLFAINQFRAAQRWRKLEFTQGEIQRFNANPMIQLCQQMLDYPRAPIFVSANAIHLTDGMLNADPLISKTDGGYVFEHSWHRLPELLAAQYITPGQILASEIVVGTAFQMMFDELEQIAIQTKAGLLDRTLTHATMYYWLQMVHEVEVALNGPTPFTDYMKDYEYEDLLPSYQGIVKPVAGYRSLDWRRDSGLPAETRDKDNQRET